MKINNFVTKNLKKDDVFYEVFYNYTEELNEDDLNELNNKLDSFLNELNSDESENEFIPKLISYLQLIKRDINIMFNQFKVLFDEHNNNYEIAKFIIDRNDLDIDIINSKVYNLYNINTKFQNDIDEQLKTNNFVPNVIIQQELINITGPPTFERFNSWKEKFSSNLLNSKFYFDNIRDFIGNYISKDNNLSTSSNSSQLSAINDDIKLLNDQIISKIAVVKDKKKKIKNIDEMNREIINFNEKLKELNIFIKNKTEEIKTSFKNMMPATSVFIDYFKSDKIPFRSNVKTVNLLIKKWIDTTKMIISDLSSIKQPDIDKLLKIYEETKTFNKLRNDTYRIFKQYDNNINLTIFSDKLKDVISTLIKIDFDFFTGIKDVDEYPIFNNDFKVIADKYKIDTNEDNDIEYSVSTTLNLLLNKVNNDRKNSEYVSAVDIISKNISIIKIIEIIKEKIIPNIRKKIINNPIPDLNKGNKYFDNFFSTNSNVSQKTYDIIESYQSVMISLLDTIEKSNNLINRGPGMHYFYNSLHFFIKSFLNFYNITFFVNIKDDGLLSIPQNHRDEFKIFEKLINGSSIENLISSSDFINFSSLLDGTLSANRFDTISINGFKSPYNTNEELNSKFIASILKAMKKFYSSSSIKYKDFYLIFNDGFSDIFIKYEISSIKENIKEIIAQEGEEDEEDGDGIDDFSTLIKLNRKIDYIIDLEYEENDEESPEEFEIRK